MNLKFNTQIIPPEGDGLHLALLAIDDMQTLDVMEAMGLQAGGHTLEGLCLAIAGKSLLEKLDLSPEADNLAIYAKEEKDLKAISDLLSRSVATREHLIKLIGKNPDIE